MGHDVLARPAGLGHIFSIRTIIEGSRHADGTAFCDVERRLQAAEESFRRSAIDAAILFQLQASYLRRDGAIPCCRSPMRTYRGRAARPKALVRRAQSIV